MPPRAEPNRLRGWVQGMLRWSDFTGSLWVRRASARFLCCLLLVPGLPGQTLADAMTAHETVVVATDELIKYLKQAIPLYEKQPDLFFDEIDRVLAPYIDFERFSRGVMARYYRKATAEQKLKFQQVFRRDLIRTYGKSLVEFDNETITVKPSAVNPGDKPGRQKIDLVVHSKSGRNYPVTYAMILNDDIWQLRNVVVNGINMGLTFRNHFSSLARTRKGNIDQVIDAWHSDLEAADE